MGAPSEVFGTRWCPSLRWDIVISLLSVRCRIDGSWDRPPRWSAIVWRSLTPAPVPWVPYSGARSPVPWVPYSCSPVPVPWVLYPCLLAPVPWVLWFLSSLPGFLGFTGRIPPSLSCRHDVASTGSLILALHSVSLAKAQDLDWLHPNRWTSFRLFSWVVSHVWG